VPADIAADVMARLEPAQVEIVEQFMRAFPR
jgi:hypothetical protein